MGKADIDKISEVLHASPHALSKEWLHETLVECVANLKRIHEMIFEDSSQPIKNIRGIKTGA